MAIVAVVTGESRTFSQRSQTLLLYSKYTSVPQEILPGAQAGALLLDHSEPSAIPAHGLLLAPPVDLLGAQNAAIPLQVSSGGVSMCQPVLVIPVST